MAYSLRCHPDIARNRVDIEVAQLWDTIAAVFSKKYSDSVPGRAHAELD
jgi:hypothetical protein